MEGEGREGGGGEEERSKQASNLVSFALVGQTLGSQEG